MEFTNPYSVLRLGPEATAADISRAYRSQLRLHHPDSRPASESAQQERLERARLQAAMDAYAVLGSPDSRSIYDRKQREKNTASRITPRIRFAAGRPRQIFAGPLVWTAPKAREK